MHMTAMAAVSIVPDPSIAAPSTMPPALLAIVIGTATLVVLALGTGASLVDQHLASRAAKEMARFRQLTDATLEGIVVHRDGLIVEVNSALTRLVGRLRPALIGHPLTDFVTPEAAQRLGRRVETGSPRRDEIDIVTADGLRRVEIFTREAEHDGGPARISAVRDITERKREEALADAEQRMLTAIAEDRPLSETLEFACRGIETVLPGAACSVLLMSPDRRTLRHVAAPSLPAAYCAAIDGAPIGSAVGSCGTAAWTGEEVIVEEIAADPLWRDYRDLALEHGLLACWSIPLKSRGGTVLGTFATYHRERYRPSEAELEVVRRLAASSAIAIQRKRQDEALIAEKEKAQAASRAKSEFLASMSHELRTPLNAILGFSEVIEHQLLGTGASERYAGYAADIHRSGRHLLDLINDLLDVARIESGKMQLDRERCDVPALVAEQVAMVRRAFPDAARIEIEDAPGCPPVMADARALGQIVLNVVGNAAKFTPADGRIVIRAASEPPGFRLIVTDDGPGIAPDLLEELGQPFRHGEAAYSRRYGGTGLGLHISSALAEAHGGRLEIASTLGQGTTVAIALPEEAVVREAPAEAVAIAAD
jgi:PAS domain S-box-containing protein